MASAYATASGKICEPGTIHSPGPRDKTKSFPKSIGAGLEDMSIFIKHVEIMCLRGQRAHTSKRNKAAAGARTWDGRPKTRRLGRAAQLS